MLIPIAIAATSNTPELMYIAISACMAGAVCGDHCSPISDTTIMSSAGAGCNHLSHVESQFPYAMTVAGVSFITYIVAGFSKSAVVSLPLGIVLMIATLFVIRSMVRKGDNARAAVNTEN
jgi:Na+/H+ antiporter NhaC